MSETRRLETADTGMAHKASGMILNAVVQVVTATAVAAASLVGLVLWAGMMLGMLVIGIGGFAAGCWTIIAFLGYLGTGQSLWMVRTLQAGATTLAIFVSLMLLSFLRAKVASLLSPTPRVPDYRLYPFAADAPFE